MGKIYAELARIQQGLKAPKNLYNNFGKYHYRNAEGILEAVKPMLDGMAIVINDEPVVIGERYYIKATVTLTDGEESVSAVAYAREDAEKKGMDGCQITGACSSYARKYALNALLMIDDSKDSDDDSLSPKNPENMPKENECQKPQNGQKAASVGTVSKLPQAGTEAAKPAAQAPNPKPYEGETPGAFIQRRIAELKAQIPGFDFMKARAALIKAEMVPDVPSATLTIDQAAQLVESVEFYYLNGQTTK